MLYLKRLLLGGAALSALAVTPAMADLGGTPKWFVDVQLGQTDIDTNFPEYLKSAMVASGFPSIIVTDDKTTAGGQLGLVYQATDRTGLEFGYRDFGTYRMNVINPPTSENIGISMSIRVGYLGALFTVRPFQSTRLHFRAGGLMSRVNATIQDGGLNSVSLGGDDGGFYAGLGISYRASRDFHIGIDAARYALFDSRDVTIDANTLGVRFKIGF